jgi:hypothetical protein
MLPVEFAHRSFLHDGGEIDECLGDGTVEADTEILVTGTLPLCRPACGF